jgi:hypothetical protein
LCGLVCLEWCLKKIEAKVVDKRKTKEIGQKRKKRDGLLRLFADEAVGDEKGKANWRGRHSYTLYSFLGFYQDGRFISPSTHAQHTKSSK